MRAEARNPFPIVRRGYDTVHVDDFVDAAAADLARLAGENRDLHRRLTADATGRRAPPEGVTTALAAARHELEQMVRTAIEERDRARAEAARAGAEVTVARTEATRIERAAREAAAALAEAACVERETVVQAARDEADRILEQATTQRESIVQAARDEADRILEQATAERQQAIGGAAADRRRLELEIEASRAELDRLVRARVDVRRELDALSEAVRHWLASTAAGQANPFFTPPERTVRRPLPPPAPRARTRS